MAIANGGQMAATTQPIHLLFQALAYQPTNILLEISAEVQPDRQDLFLDVIKRVNSNFTWTSKQRAYHCVERDKPIIDHLLRAIEEGTFIDAVRSFVLRGDSQGIRIALELKVDDENIVINSNDPELLAFADFLVKLSKWKLDEEKGNSEIDHNISGELFAHLKQPNGRAILKGAFKLFGSKWVHQAVFKLIQLHECLGRSEISDEEKDFLLDQCAASARPDLLGKLLDTFILTDSSSGCSWVLGKDNFNVNYANERGQSLLSKALWKKNMDLANRLLDRGADIWHKDQNGYTPVDVSGYVSPTQWRLYKYLLLQRTFYTIAWLIASIGLMAIFTSVLNWLDPPQPRTYQWIQ